jgi:hypothetical protein
LLPLVANLNQKYASGWITYSSDFKDAPEVEYFCGGLNVKHPTAAGLWRQGNLLHFGFEQSPAELNEIGRALLLNSIAYISQFTEDRPIAQTPSVFAGPYPRARRSVANVISNEYANLTDLQYYLAPAALAVVKRMDRHACQAWFDQNGGYLHAIEDGKLDVDKEAKDFGTPFDQLAFFERAIAAMGEAGGAADRAQRLLKRYAPDGPVNGSVQAWESWFKENRSFLFFSDPGGYRWYVDPLAKKRGIPTADLRGPARATTPSQSSSR